MIVRDKHTDRHFIIIYIIIIIIIIGGLSHLIVSINSSIISIFIVINWLWKNRERVISLVRCFFLSALLYLVQQFWIMLNYFLMAKKLENWILSQGPRGCQLFVPNSIFYGDPILICIEKWSFGHFCLKFEEKRTKDLFCGKQNQVEMVQTFLRRIHRTRKRSGRNFWDCH